VGDDQTRSEVAIPLRSQGRLIGVFNAEHKEINGFSPSRIVFYSDGVTEAMNSSLEQYGETRLRDHVAKPSASGQSLLNDIRTFTAGQPASDDVTVVMVQA
jgi:serine phosphatase RsbU (regulator of sigma subunit)